MNFSNINYTECTNLNVVQCAPWDNWCVDSLKLMVNRKADLDNTVEMKECKKCDILLSYDSSPAFKLPVLFNYNKFLESLFELLSKNVLSVRWR